MEETVAIKIETYDDLKRKEIELENLREAITGQTRYYKNGTEISGMQIIGGYDESKTEVTVNITRLINAIRRNIKDEEVEIRII